MKDRIEQNRKAIRPSWSDLYDLKTYKKMNKPKPEKFLHIDNGLTIDLLKEFKDIKQKSLSECIASRRSLRAFKDQSLTFEELSYLLWETSRVDHIENDIVYKTIPTAGATNSGETFVFINDVEKIESGVYLYIQDKHQLSLVNDDDNINEIVNKALLRQLRGAQVVFYFTHVLPRVEYKYAYFGPKLATLEAGHACQNLSLTAEVIDAGACAIAAYNQEETDHLLKINGADHFTIYCATVGKKK
ncbi:MAG: SagB/ThcOx family dehydrogenase [Tenericutes bacterium]|jgi:SagB-type dehydrogenase family enzyme|nr:SagB/ThcOx family dehydrogenase [Mycoplasmatota bacterium]